MKININKKDVIKELKGFKFEEKIKYILITNYDCLLRAKEIKELFLESGECHHNILMIPFLLGRNRERGHAFVRNWEDRRIAKHQQKKLRRKLTIKSFRVLLAKRSNPRIRTIHVVQQRRLFQLEQRRIVLSCAG